MIIQTTTFIKHDKFDQNLVKFDQKKEKKKKERERERLVDRRMDRWLDGGHNLSSVLLSSAPV